MIITTFGSLLCGIDNISQKSPWYCHSWSECGNIKEYFVKYCQSRITLLWIWMMLWSFKYNGRKNFQDANYREGMHHLGVKKKLRAHKTCFTYFICADEQFLSLLTLSLLFQSCFFTCSSTTTPNVKKHVWFNSVAEPIFWNVRV